jgi:hypothetical protein
MPFPTPNKTDSCAEFNAFLDGLSLLTKSEQKTTILREYENGVLSENLVSYAFGFLELEAE